jgi:hypothetical protein
MYHMFYLSIESVMTVESNIEELVLFKNVI